MPLILLILLDAQQNNKEHQDQKLDHHELDTLLDRQRGG
jgi:hypothetical protein